jgi:hypothetical protein
MPEPRIYGIPKAQWYQLSAYQQEQVMYDYYQNQENDNYNSGGFNAVFVNDNTPPVTNNYYYSRTPAPQSRVIVVDRDKHHHHHQKPFMDRQRWEEMKRRHPHLRNLHEHRPGMGYQAPQQAQRGSQGGIGFQAPEQGKQPGEATVVHGFSSSQQNNTSMPQHRVFPRPHHHQEGTQGGMGFQAPQTSAEKFSQREELMKAHRHGNHNNNEGAERNELRKALRDSDKDKREERREERREEIRKKLERAGF